MIRLSEVISLGIDINNLTWAESIKMTIQEGFNDVISGMGESISNAFSKVLVSTGSVLLDGACFFIVYFMVWTSFKIMVGVDQKKQESNFNTLGITVGVYMVVRMVTELITRGI